MEMQNPETRMILSAASWERMVLCFDAMVEGNPAGKAHLRFFVQSMNGGDKFPLSARRTETGRYHLTLNVTNPGSEQWLPVGSYGIYCEAEGVAPVRCCVAPEALPFLPNAARFFADRKKPMGYAVTLLTEEEEIELPLVLHCMKTTEQDPMVPAGEQLSEEEKKQEKAKAESRGEIQDIYEKNRAARGENKKPKLLFLSCKGGRSGQNLAAVYQQMQERGMDRTCDLDWMDGAKLFPMRSKAALKNLVKRLAMCDWLFLDAHLSLLDWLELAPDLKVVQLADTYSPFLPYGYCAAGRPDCRFSLDRKRQYDFLIAASEDQAEEVARQWGVNPERVLPTGMPWMDHLPEAEAAAAAKEAFLDRYPLLGGRRIILFAPEARGEGSQSCYPYEEIDLEMLEVFCGEDNAMIVKMPSNMQEPPVIPAVLQDRVFLAESFPDTDLLSIADAFLLDYPADLNAYIAQGKPMVFFAFDALPYLAAHGCGRGYHQVMPGAVCEDFHEVLRALEHTAELQEKAEAAKADLRIGGAADRVIDQIFLSHLK